MTTKNRSDLKSYFVKNAIPTEGNFADLIDSQLNQTQDGVFKPDGEALSVIAAPGDQKRVLRLFASSAAANPDWMISLNPAQDPANAATTSKPGFGITDGAGKPRLFIDAATGNIGMGTNTPGVALDVTGTMRASRFLPRYDTVLNDYRTPNPAFNVGLAGPPDDRDAWIYRVSATSGGDNVGIYHREINTAIAGLPANSIGFVGGGSSKLQAYVSLDDGSGFFAGNLTVAGQITAGGAQLGGSRIQYDLVLNDYQTVNPSSNVCLPGPPSDRDAWIYRASDSSSNWGIYHREINSLVGGLPANSIGFVGGGSNKLQAYVNLGDGSGYFAGNVGIGTTTPQASLHVTNGSRFTGGRHYFTDQEGTNRLRVGIAWGIPGLYSEDNADIVVGCASGKKVHLGQENTVTVKDSNLTVSGNIGSHGYDPNAALSKGLSGGVTTYDVIAYGSVYSKDGYKTTPSDLAERFARHEDNLEPGDVLAIDPRSPERLIRSRSAQQDDLVGVVSEHPGFVLGVPWEDPHAGIPLALAGRVPVKVNLEGGPIRIGDYLTSSSQPGVAMRTIESGRVLGMAMEAFDGTSGDEGKVVVFVNPHWFGGR